MSWTDERVSLLKKLWGEGKTAAEIAGELGGVTRNAVIGKAHRLKLSNRVSPIQQNAKKAANTNSVAKKVEPAPKEKKVAVPPVQQAQTIEGGREYSLMELGPRQCRWPSGDPRNEDFGFCGAECVPGLPYCAEHAKVAYQTSSRARTLNAADFEDKASGHPVDDDNGDIKAA